MTTIVKKVGGVGEGTSFQSVRLFYTARRYPVEEWLSVYNVGDNSTAKRKRCARPPVKDRERPERPTLLAEEVVTCLPSRDVWQSKHEKYLG